MHQMNTRTCAADPYDADIGLLAAVLDEHPHGPGELSRTLAEVEAMYGYLPRAALSEIARSFACPLPAVYAVAALRTRRRQAPRETIAVRVCSGRLCHVPDTSAILRTIAEELDLGPGEGCFNGVTIERIKCAECDGLSPVTVVAASH